MQAPPTWPPAGPLLLELDRATEDHERLRQKARRYAKALPRSEFVDDEPLLVFAVPTRARRDGVAAALASSSVPTRVIVWTPQHSPLAALRDALDDPTHEFPSDPSDRSGSSAGPA